MKIKNIFKPLITFKIFDETRRTLTLLSVDIFLRFRSTKEKIKNTFLSICINFAQMNCIHISLDQT